MSHASSSVAMVSGLHPAKMNCTRIFNLFCLYGNIEKVKRAAMMNTLTNRWNRNIMLDVLMVENI